MTQKGQWEKEVIVLIPQYNRPEELTRCLDSLRRNTTNDKYDLLIVDDCSPMEREVMGVINRMSATQSNWRMIKTPQNGGFTKCVNYGIKYLQHHRAEYKYILLLNNDAVVGPDWLPRMVSAFDDPKDVGIVAPFTAVWCPDSIYPTPVGWDRPYATEGNPIDVRTAMIDEFNSMMWYEEHVGFSGVLIRLDLFEKYGLFDERFNVIAQDLDWSHRIGKYGWRTKVIGLRPGEIHLIGHHGRTHIDLKPSEEIDPLVEADNRLIREIWPEKYDHQLNKRHWGLR